MGNSLKTKLFIQVTKSDIASFKAFLLFLLGSILKIYSQKKSPCYNKLNVKRPLGEAL